MAIVIKESQQKTKLDLPGLPHFLIVDLLADLSPHPPQDEQLDHGHDGVDEDAGLAGFARHDVFHPERLLTAEQTQPQREQEIVDAVYDAAGPDVPGLPVEQQKRQTEDAARDRLADRLSPGQRSREIRADHVRCAEDQRAADGAQDEDVFLVSELIYDRVVDDRPESHFLEQPDKDEHQEHGQHLKRHVVTDGGVRAHEEPEDADRQSKDPEAHGDLDDVPGRIVAGRESLVPRDLIQEEGHGAAEQRSHHQALEIRRRGEALEADHGIYDRNDRRDQRVLFQKVDVPS